MMSYSERVDCRACHGPLELIHNFGEFEVVNFGDKEPLKSPLELMFCKSCSLVQLKHTVNPDLLFRQYYYKSGVNQTMQNHLQEIAEDIKTRVRSTDYILDIGANDGTFLSFFDRNSSNRIGFEPSQIEPNIVQKPEFWVRDYFSAKAYESFKLRKANVVTCIAMFYDLDDPGKFLDDVKQVLARDGLLVIEQNYLPRMLEDNRVDNIVTEHLCYYSFTTMARLLARHKFQIEDVKFDDTNGGVFRLYIRHSEFPLQTAVGINEENLDKLDTYQHFVNRVLNNAERLRRFVSSVRYGTNGTIDVYAASTRGLILMQIANLDHNLIRYAVDRNPAKHGKLYNGIKVVSEETMRKDPPDYLLILAQGFLPEFIQREWQFLKDGGKFILPFDRPRSLGLDSL